MSESTTEMTGMMIDPVTGEIIDQKDLAVVGHEVLAAGVPVR
ncbi:hypothetical protein ACT4S5_09460 [Kocuria oceani]